MAYKYQYLTFFLLLIFKTQIIMSQKIVPHEKFKNFQEQYGPIPASDKNDMHIIKSRMLQGIYRGKKIDNIYCNYLSDSAGSINFMRNKKLENYALQELSDIKKRERLTDEERLMTNLLSSQPMAFNIFLPLKWNDYSIATCVFSNLFPELKILSIDNIRLEYVPGDDNGKAKRVIQTDNSCFDVYIEYTDLSKSKAGIGIEVKYTESFSQSDYNKVEGEKKERYIRAINTYNQTFNHKNTEKYLSPKFNQLFRNQLLAVEVNDKFKMNCVQIVLHSSQDTKCIEPIEEFQNLLNQQNVFFTLTIEQFISAILKCTPDNDERKQLYESIFNRYCNYSLLNKVIYASETQKIKESNNVHQYSFINEININDIPSSRNWKEIYDFAFTFDSNVLDSLKTNDLVVYSEMYYKKHQTIEHDLTIVQLRAVLKNYIIKMKLTRDQYPDKSNFKFTSSLIDRIHQIIYESLWDGK